MAYGMLIDLKRCVGCQGCTVTCKAANCTPPGVTRAHVVREDEGTYPNVRRTLLPLLCMHCEEPPCVAVCPAGATEKRAEDGIVVIDKETCIGCKSCIAACPYGARYYIESEEGYFGEMLTSYEELGYAAMPKGTVDKCDFCLSRAEDGKDPVPACVRACRGKARIFGELEDIKKMAKELDGYLLYADEGTVPQVYYTPNFVCELK